MRRALKTIVLAALAIGAGAGSAAFLTSEAGVKPDFSNGPWDFYEGVGEPNRSIYRRAFVARLAWFGLPASETIYGTARRDSSGALLRDDCTYRISGSDVDTRWWSVTAYRDRHWMPNPSQRYAWSSADVMRAADGSWSLLLSRAKQAGNWLPLNDRPGPLTLVVRLYNPLQTLRDRLRTTKQLPRIERQECSAA